MGESCSLIPFIPMLCPRIAQLFPGGIYWVVFIPINCWFKNDWLILMTAVFELSFFEESLFDKEFS